MRGLVGLLAVIAFAAAAKASGSRMAFPHYVLGVVAFAALDRSWAFAVLVAPFTPPPRSGRAAVRRRPRIS
ncbi:MAG: hypothetical protein HYS40_01235 [Gemmatimonadetes bacterium]|nr:hypothetical protein [Gemmatimonadota bacterium]